MKTPPHPQKYCEFCERLKKKTLSEYLLVIFFGVNRREQSLCEQHYLSKLDYVTRRNIMTESYKIDHESEKRVFIFR